MNVRNQRDKPLERLVLCVGSSSQSNVRTADAKVRYRASHRTLLRTAVSLRAIPAVGTVDVSHAR